MAKRILIVLMGLFSALVFVACATTITTGTVTPTETTTSTPTETVTETTTTTALDFSQIAVSAFVTNGTHEFADISASITPWNEALGGATTISVDDLTLYQSYYGTGAALTYSSAYLIDNSVDREEIIQYLFGEDGLHVQLIRLCIGASDFVTEAIGHYTYDDTPGNISDEDLDYFSIEKDRVILDVLKDALLINPDLVIMASPWSAPAWMKTNHSLYGGSLSSTSYNVYAKYLIRFLEAYAEEGIHIDYLSVQNEPYYASDSYPGMTWDIDMTKIFIGSFLGPQLTTAGLDAKIMIWDHNPVDNAGALIDFPVRVLRSATASVYIKAIGVHCYTGDDQDMYDFLDYLHANNPEVEVFMTECTAVTAYKDRQANMEWSVRRMYTEAFNRHASGTAYWNLVLDPAGNTHLGGCGTCTGLLSVPVNGTGGYTVEADGFVTGHFSRYVEVGARRIAVLPSNPSLLSTGFVDAGGQITLVVFNDGPSRTVTVIWRGSKFQIVLLASSMTTLFWTLPA